MQSQPPYRKHAFKLGVITHLQSILETERIAVSRELHDDMGGLLVGAVMDVAWLEQHVAAPYEARKILERVRQALTMAVDLKRKLIEQLRPSLLDNIGLFTALRWHVAQVCADAEVACTQDYPTEEPPFTAEALTSLYRILQETLAIALKQPAIQSLSVDVRVDGDVLTMKIAHDSRTLPGRDAETSLAMAAMKHRVRVLGGRLTIRQIKTGGAAITTHIPFDSVLCPGTPGCNTPGCEVPLEDISRRKAVGR